MSSSPPTFSINLTGSFGVCLSMAFLSTALWGANIVQAFVFYTKSRADPRATKALVAWLLTCETARLVLIIKGLFRPLIVEWGNAIRLAATIPEFEWQNIPFALIMVPAQAFFIFRIYRLTNQPLWMFSPLIAALFGQLVGTGLHIVFTIHKQFTQEVVTNKKAIDSIWAVVSLGLAVDVFIAAFLTYYVLRHRSGLPHTDNMINRLVFFSIATGLWTAFLALAIMITMVVASKTLVFLSLQFLTSGFYVTSVMANLNARGWVRGTSEIVQGMTSIFDSSRESRQQLSNFQVRSSASRDSRQQLSNFQVRSSARTRPDSLELFQMKEMPTALSSTVHTRSEIME